ncbi:MAG: FAD-dependent oxidoreductase [Candidatus Peregrinibacteria bacterium]|nr:FAD-dependent oxidoreductase [Candidatus Peregrinibacteria bacterium]MDZ4244963.1 FAD-dependent oxidoreductase [Candidatus Gracilibacteria bacterium]
MNEEQKTYDMIILGTGMAGLASAVYAGRFGMNVLVLGELHGGTITQTHLVENYPGYKSISGFELGMKFMEHAKSVEAEIKNSKVVDVRQREDKMFEVEDKKGNVYTGYSILLATGLAHRHLEVPGEDEYANKGVSYCATCDSPLFKGKKTIVVGGGDSAFKESLFVAEHADHVTIMYRGPEEKLRPEPINAERVKQNPKIDLMVNTSITEVRGDGNLVTEVVLQDGSVFPVDGIFVEIGGTARSEFAEKLGCALDPKKQIIIDRYSRTNIDGVYAAGDVTDSEWKQGVVCAAEGAAAAYAAYDHVNKVKR